MMTGVVQDEKRIGCMSGFLQIFDRQQILAGKRVHSSKRLLPSTAVGASPKIVSPNESAELKKHVVAAPPAAPAENVKIESKSPLVSSAFELKEGTQKHTRKSFKDMPPLSLDSQATFDSKGSLRTKDVRINNAVSSSTDTTLVGDGDDNQGRSPSVIARLMGLNSLSSPDKKDISNHVAAAPKRALKRSLLESRVKYIDNNNFQVKQPSQLQKQTDDTIVKDKHIICIKPEPSKTNSWKSRTVFDSADFYPVSTEEQDNDLGTLKQILEVLHLKGLLHSSRPLERQRNFVYDRNLHSDESNIVVVKPCRSPVSKVDDRSGRNSPVRGRSSSLNRIESNLKSCNSIVKRKPLSVEIRRRANESLDLRSSPIKSPKVTPKRNVASRLQSNHRQSESLNRKLIKTVVVTEDELSSISESTVSTQTTIESERSKCESLGDEKTLLQRCDKLLESISKMNNMSKSPPSSIVVLPSPVSVLDSGFDKDESLSPSHSIEYKITPHSWSHLILPAKPTKHEEFISSDRDFIYITEILKSSQCRLDEDPNAFLSIEKQLYNNTKDTSNVSKQHRKLVFDIITEILDRNNQLPPWNVEVTDSRSSVKNIWFEFEKIREVNTADGLLDLISGVLRKDLVEINDWGDYLLERSDLILDIERLVFKDMVSEAIQDFGEFSSRCRFSRAQRKLVF